AAILRSSDEAAAEASAAAGLTTGAEAGAMPAPVATSGPSRRLFGRARSAAAAVKPAAIPGQAAPTARPQREAPPEPPPPPGSTDADTLARLREAKRRARGG
ncbi:MAG: hypothetical protein L0227_13105, partial [Chloroflexi bacterium]|nr:hypothetical protein [Chloroflexota bacterium]